MQATRKFAAVLTPDARRRVRGLIDPVLAPFGSIARAKHPTSLVALTFDDGPDPAVTPRLASYLDEAAVRATFFILTGRAAAHPEIVRDLAASGHEIGLHCDDHDRLPLLKTSDVRERLRRARAVLEDMCGQPIRFFRPPYGAQSLASFRAARELGLEVVVWGPAAYDWEEQSPERAADRALAGVRGGEIVLLHDGLALGPGEAMPGFDRVRMVELIITRLRDAGLEPATVGQLVESAGAHKTAWFRP